METSRVLVTYSDSSGVYPSIAEAVRARLPLRNLNWNAPSRPFRSIPSLHVELIRDATSTKPLKEVEGDWAIKSDESKEEDARQGRRHQIPGLRQSPYLKIYFLKCDDVDTYRATSRKDVREWINGHTPESQKSSSTNKRDNHDAFEWLIVQVVDKSPDRTSTPEVSSGSKDEADSKSKRFSTLSRLSSRGSTTSVIEKLRSDFNGTSKNAIDRVVQITQEGDKAGFDDMVAKMKALILASFDLRVAQYEDDIKEKEMQRNLPGWNFNTFFVLKEGLARGFEAVGLLEDALTGYHELATGLNAIVKEQQGENAAEQAAAAPFNEYTDELHNAFVDSTKAQSESSQTSPSDTFDLGSTILDTSRKDFRHLILANGISVFDFQCYVFARQINLLLRLANAGPGKRESSNGHPEADKSATAGLAKPSDDEPENLLVLAETCQLASEFTALAASTMREDIEASMQKTKDYESGITTVSNVLVDYIIDNLVSSWTNSVCEAVLEATSSQTLSAQLRPFLGQLLPGRNFGTDAPQSISVVSRRHERLPDRTSSLTGASKPKTPVQESFSSIVTPEGLRLLPPGTLPPGARELAAQRGNLFVLSRRVLVNLGYGIHGWQGGLSIAAAELQNNDQLVDEDLGGDTTRDCASSSTSSAEPKKPTTNGIQNETLLSALHSEYEFYKAFEELTAMALAHYVVGGRTNAAEGMTVDLAMVRFNLKDYKTAAPYFDQLAGFYGRNNWRRLEITMLAMHAQCLKEMGRAEEYIKVAMEAIAAQKHRPETLSMESCSLAELIITSNSLIQPLTVLLDDHFDGIQLDPYLRHYPGHDGFQMGLRLRSLLPEPFRADSLRIKIISVDQNQTGEHWLSVDGPLDMVRGTNKLLFGTKSMYPGFHKLVSINIQAKNILFVHDRTANTNTSFFSSERDSGSLGKSVPSEGRFLVWARHQHLHVRLSHFETIDLRRPKSIKIEISSGWNNILYGKLSMKAASAGLRIDTAESKAAKSGAGGDTAAATISTKKYQPGAVDFGKLPENEVLAIQIPYSLETDLNEIFVKLQVEYKTDAGDFMYVSDCKLNVTLPVSVNVQDIFKQNALFPKFTIGTATSRPLRLISCSIEGNSNYDAISPDLIDQPVDIFARQPYSFVSRIHRKQVINSGAPQSSRVFQRLLHLHIEYHSLDQEILAEVEASLLDALVSASLQHLSRLLQDTLRVSLQSKYSSADLETACLLNEYPTGVYEDFNWEPLLASLSLEDGEKLEQTLRKWHQEIPTVPLETGRPRLSQKQYLTVPFDLPSTHVVHTARLRPLKYDAATMSEQASIAIDQPMPMQLDISHTRQWDADLMPDNDTSALEFSYEMHTSPDTWLIGGQRKAMFSAKEGETHTFAVLLVPQSTGRLLYPTVEITPVSTAHGDKESAEGSALSSETDYLSQSESILVVPNLASTTVSLDPANGGWLVESRSREP